MLTVRYVRSSIRQRFAPSATWYTAFVRAVLTYVGWWIALFFVWHAFQGEWNRIEWIAAACAATLGAAFAVVVAHLGVFGFRIPPRAVRDGAKVPVQVVIDFSILTAALVRRISGRRVEGTFVTRTFPSRGSGELAAGDRATRTFLSSISPNAYLIDIDPGQHIVLFHDLVVNRNSEKPA